jgi:hypothetical protein
LFSAANNQPAKQRKMAENGGFRMKNGALCQSVCSAMYLRHGQKNWLAINRGDGNKPDTFGASNTTTQG